jgi:hypothetical protein
MGAGTGSQSLPRARATNPASGHAAGRKCRPWVLPVTRKIIKAHQKTTHMNQVQHRPLGPSPQNHHHVRIPGSQPYPSVIHVAADAPPPRDACFPEPHEASTSMRFSRRVPPPPPPPSASPSGTAAISPSSSPSHSRGLALILSCLSTHHSSRRPWRRICAREDGASVMREDGTEADLGSRAPPSSSALSGPLICRVPPRSPPTSNTAAASSCQRRIEKAALRGRRVARYPRMPVGQEHGQGFLPAGTLAAGHRLGTLAHCRAGKLCTRIYPTRCYPYT